jgi:4-hydroxybenzoate polyprenyltransferase
VVLLLGVSLAPIAWLDALAGRALPSLSLCGVSYVVLNVLYTLRIKSIPILDVLCIAMGFVIRVVAGALAIQVPVSPWLVVCTFMLSLFIGITKRRSEVLNHAPDRAREIRNANAFYTPERLEHMISVAASLAIMSYSLYCLAPQTQERVGSVHLVWTIPVVVYGIFRYTCISGVSGTGDPVRILLKDRGMALTGLVWLILALLIIYL